MKFLSALVLASAISEATAYTQHCLTYYGSTKVKKVPRTTSSTTVTATSTVVSTTQSTETDTAPASTNTITETVSTETTTTLSTATDVVSTTVYDTTTTTLEAEPVTSTVTSTTSTSTTTTVGPFFTGVQDSLPGVDAYSGGASGNKRDVEEPANGLSPWAQLRRDKILARAATSSSYPTAVTCSKIYTHTRYPTITSTLAPTTTTTTPPASTSTETDTVTATATVVPSPVTSTDTISSTITSTETDTATSTSTATTTTTNTVTVQAVPSVACNSYNYAESVRGVNIIAAVPETNSEDFAGTSDTTVGSCCLTCQNLPNCGAFQFLTSTNKCQVATTSGSCSLNSDPFQVLLGNSKRNIPVVVGNGLCGEYVDEVSSS